MTLARLERLEREAKVWRPLLMGEYPPPGPTKLGGKVTDKERPILVYAADTAQEEDDGTGGGEGKRG